MMKKIEAKQRALFADAHDAARASAYSAVAEAHDAARAAASHAAQAAWIRENFKPDFKKLLG